jgi:hypothetical protein
MSLHKIFERNGFDERETANRRAAGIYVVRVIEG